MKPTYRKSLHLSTAILVVLNGFIDVNLAQQNTWIRTGGPLGGLGYDIRMHPLHPDTMFVTDGFAGVFKSIDGGKNWFPSNSGIPRKGGPSGDAIPIFCLTIDQNNPDIVWAGMQQQLGIFKSVDGGNSWVEKVEGIEEPTGITFRGFSVDPRSSDIVYAAGEISSTLWAGKDSIGAAFDKTKGVVYKTTDGGENWNAIWRGENLARYIFIHPYHPDTLYVSTGIFDREAANSDHIAQIPGGEGILKSTDGGITWQQKNNGLTNLYIGTLFMHPKNPDTLLAGSANEVYPDGNGVFLTTDGGESWNQVHGDRAESVEFSLSDPKIAYAGNDASIYKSIDGGQNWNKVSTGADGWGSPEVQAGVPIDFQVDPNKPDRLFANNYGGGNFLSEDGGVTWNVASAGYTGVEVHDLCISPTDPMRVYAAARSGVFASSDGGNNWEGLNFGVARSYEYLAVTINPANPKKIIAANYINPTILISDDAAITWQDTEHSLPEGRFWSAFRFAPSDTTIVYAGTSTKSPDPSKGVYRSEDGGISWTPANDTLSQDASITALAIDPSNPEVVYTATREKGVLKTLDGGKSWAAIDEGLPENVFKTSLAIHPNDSKTIYVGTVLSGLYKTTDGGDNWNLVTAGLPAEMDVTCVIIDPANPSVQFVGGLFDGVYRTLDGGDFWQQINNDLLTRAIKKLAISANGQILYAGTYGEGVFRLNDAEGPITGIYEQNLANSFELEQNYPNPFNTETIIKYRLSNNYYVSLQIFNIQGQLVRTLVNGRQSAGNYSVYWDGTSDRQKPLTGGVYVYSLRASHLVKTGKMIMLPK